MKLKTRDYDGETVRILLYWVPKVCIENENRDSF